MGGSGGCGLGLGSGEITRERKLMRKKRAISNAISPLHYTPLLCCFFPRIQARVHTRVPFSCLFIVIINSQPVLFGSVSGLVSGHRRLGVYYTWEGTEVCCNYGKRQKWIWIWVTTFVLELRGNCLFADWRLNKKDIENETKQRENMKRTCE